MQTLRLLRPYGYGYTSYKRKKLPFRGVQSVDKVYI